MAISDSLMAKVKRKLDISWSDPDTDARLRDIAETAETVIPARVGVPSGTSPGFDNPGLMQEIFLNYCFYAWSHATAEFFQAYEAEILTARAGFEVMEDADPDQGSETGFEPSL